MLNTFIRNVVEPLAGRIGTFSGGVLVTWGVSDPHANAIGLGVSAGILVGVDLVTRKLLEWQRNRPLR